MKVLMSEEDIENPRYIELMNYIDHGEYAVCPICGSEGQFFILKFEFDDEEIINDSVSPIKPYAIYSLKSDKNNGEIRCWNEPGSYSIGHVGIAFDSFNKFFKNELLNEPLVGKEIGNIELKVEFFKDPFYNKVILHNEGYSQKEIIMVVNGYYDQIPNDQK